MLLNGHLLCDRHSLSWRKEAHFNSLQLHTHAAWPSLAEAHQQAGGQQGSHYWGCFPPTRL